MCNTPECRKFQIAQLARQRICTKKHVEISKTTRGGCIRRCYCKPCRCSFGGEKTLEIHTLEELVSDETTTTSEDEATQVSPYDNAEKNWLQTTYSSTQVSSARYSKPPQYDTAGKNWPRTSHTMSLVHATTEVKTSPYTMQKQESTTIKSSIYSGGLSQVVTENITTATTEVTSPHTMQKEQKSTIKSSRYPGGASQVVTGNITTATTEDSASPYTVQKEEKTTVESSRYSGGVSHVVTGNVTRKRLMNKPPLKEKGTNIPEDPEDYEMYRYNVISLENKSPERTTRVIAKQEFSTGTPKTYPSKNEKNALTTTTEDNRLKPPISSSRTSIAMRAYYTDANPDKISPKWEKTTNIKSGCFCIPEEVSPVNLKPENVSPKWEETTNIESGCFCSPEEVSPVKPKPVKISPKWEETAKIESGCYCSPEVSPVKPKPVKVSPKWEETKNIKTSCGCSSEEVFPVKTKWEEPTTLEPGCYCCEDDSISHKKTEIYSYKYSTQQFSSKTVPKTKEQDPCQCIGEGYVSQKTASEKSSMKSAKSVKSIPIPVETETGESCNCSADEPNSQKQDLSKQYRTSEMESDLCLCNADESVSQKSSMKSAKSMKSTPKPEDTKTGESCNCSIEEPYTQKQDLSKQYRTFKMESDLCQCNAEESVSQKSSMKSAKSMGSTPKPVDTKTRESCNCSVDEPYTQKQDFSKQYRTLEIKSDLCQCIGEEYAIQKSSMKSAKSMKSISTKSADTKTGECRNCFLDEEVLVINEYSKVQISSSKIKRKPIPEANISAAAAAKDSVVRVGISPCSTKGCPATSKRSILKLELEKGDKATDYLVVKGPMYVRRSLIRDSSPVELDLKNPSTMQKTQAINPGTVKALEECKKSSKKGICAAKELIELCEYDPDSIINMYRSQRTDKPYLTEENIASNEFLMQKTHGDIYGDPEYHYLMVDKFTNVNELDFGKVDEIREFRYDPGTEELLQTYSAESEKKGSAITLLQVHDSIRYMRVEPVSIIEETRENPVFIIDSPNQQPDSLTGTIVDESDLSQGKSRKNVTRLSTVSWKLGPFKNHSDDSIGTVTEKAKRKMPQQKTHASTLEEIVREEKRRNSLKVPLKSERSSRDLMVRSSMEAVGKKMCCWMRRGKKKGKVLYHFIMMMSHRSGPA
ncbi:hypothetical protein JTB14_015661 [Gonioctena quinquepunctata]|nr:hypothetical protein JTB14_015661 [Gonioctena quinquepunctata]